MTHTPGPWKYEELMADGMVVTTGRRFEITTPNYDVCALIHRSGPIRNEDDARLIAAAPEMFAGLEAAVHALRSYQYGNSSPDLAEGVADHLQGIIDKAKGPQP